MRLGRVVHSVQSLVVFEVAARNLSFTLAARELGSTQSAVSQQVRALEDYIGIQLFVRIYRGVKLTEAGQRLFDVVHEGFDRIEGTLLGLQKQKLHPRINVGADFALASYWLLPRLPQFREQYPDIDIRLFTSQRQFEFTADEVDVAIVFGDGNFRNMKSSILFQEKVFPVCSNTFLDKHGAVESLSDLAASPLLALNDNKDNHWLSWGKLFDNLGGTGELNEPVMSFNNYTLLVQSVIAGQGIGLGWDTLIDELLSSDVLLALPQFTVCSEMGYYVAQPQHEEQTEAVECFVQWLKDAH